jgi:ankyrin repeat protein
MLARTGHLTIQFILHSVQEYFVNGQGIENFGELDLAMATCTMQLNIVRACYHSILPSIGSASHTRGPIHDYASEFMFSHARSAEEGQTVEHDLAHIFNWPQEDFVTRLATFSRKHKTREGCLEKLACKGMCLLHFAAEFDIPNLVSSVLALAPDLSIDTRDLKDRTPLHFAAQKGSYGTLDRLLNLGRPFELALTNRVLDLNARDSEGYTPLMCAARDGHSDVVLERLARTPGLALDALHPITHSTALLLAIKSSRVAAAEIMMHHGANVRIRDHKGQTPLGIASRIASCESTNEKQSEEMLALFRSLLAGATEDLCLRDDVRRTPLKYGLSGFRSRAFTELLLEERLDPNALDQYGCTWLSYLGQHTDCETVKLLLAQPGVNPNHSDRKGKTPLARLIGRPFVDESTVEALLEDPRVDACSRDTKGRTPLMIATANGCFSGVRALLDDARTNAHAIDNHNHSAMYYAVTRQTEVEA